MMSTAWRGMLSKMLQVETESRSFGFGDSALGEASLLPSSNILSSRGTLAQSSLAKRVIDITISALALVALIPVFVVIAVAIRATSPGPIFFCQRRHGAGRKVFSIFKFRTMTVMESDGRFRQASPADPRITPVGRILRKYSLDELPQLINVLLGDMSLVGPRPHALAMDNEFSSTIPNYDDRFFVRPGMTGLAQVMGFRGPTTTDEDINRRLEADRDYISHWSVRLDLKILAQTPLALLKQNAF
jgi:lipopolysaccharide/colanic/teichoic acid biosynthesis glycosyltransferase